MGHSNHPLCDNIHLPAIVTSPFQEMDSMIMLHDKYRWAVPVILSLYPLVTPDESDDVVIATTMDLMCLRSALTHIPEKSRIPIEHGERRF